MTAVESVGFPFADNPVASKDCDVATRIRAVVARWRNKVFMFLSNIESWN